MALLFRSGRALGRGCGTTATNAMRQPTAGAKLGLRGAMPTAAPPSLNRGLTPVVTIVGLRALACPASSAARARAATLAGRRQVGQARQGWRRQQHSSSTSAPAPGGTGNRSRLRALATGGVALGLGVGATSLAQSDPGTTAGTAMMTPHYTVCEPADAGAPKPSFRFGAIADIQYCDVDDCFNFSKTEKRKYRGSVDVLRRAVADWRNDDKLDFVVHLGDIIDQQNFGMNTSHEALDVILSVFHKLPESLPVVNLIGNHELYNFTRKELEVLLDMSPYSKRQAHYSFLPAPDRPGRRWRIVVLDSYAVNCIDQKEHNDGKDEAFEYLGKHNPNELRKKGGNWLTGLEGINRRFVPYNGAIGDAQRVWLDGVLAEADAAGEQVILMGHVPLAPGSCVNSCLSWDHEAVLDILDAHGCVTAVFSGHDHAGGYAFRNGVHYVTFPSPLNVKEEDPRAHATVEVFDDKIVLLNRGLLTRQLGGLVVELPHHKPIVTSTPADPASKL